MLPAGVSDGQTRSYRRRWFGVLLIDRRTASHTGSWLGIVSKSRCGEFHRMGNERRHRVYECYWAHFAAEIHLSE